MPDLETLRRRYAIEYMTTREPGMEPVEVEPGRKNPDCPACETETEAEAMWNAPCIAECNDCGLKFPFERAVGADLDDIIHGNDCKGCEVHLQLGGKCDWPDPSVCGECTEEKIKMKLPDLKEAAERFKKEVAAMGINQKEFSEALHKAAVVIKTTEGIAAWKRWKGKERSGD